VQLNYLSQKPAMKYLGRFRLASYLLAVFFAPHGSGAVQKRRAS
jgi:hypothetical protein